MSALLPRTHARGRFFLRLFSLILVNVLIANTFSSPARSAFAAVRTSQHEPTTALSAIGSAPFAAITNASLSTGANSTLTS